MNANQLTFGIEIETFCPQSLLVETSSSEALVIGSRHHGVQVPYLPTGWKAEHDGSVHPANPSTQIDCEIVSPILRGAEGLRQVIEVCATLEAKGHKVNATCGIHIHVGWNGAEMDAAALARLVCEVSYVERGLFAITGTKARERGANGMCYCKSIRANGTCEAATTKARGDRYHALNLQNLAYGKHTVEFRLFSGSTSALKIVGWTMACLGLVERAVNNTRPVPFIAPEITSGGLKRKGAGATECNRLLAFLGWALNTGPKFGLISDAFSLDAIRAEFRRLADKYDACA